MPTLKPSVVMTFGRFNPPTKGHEKLFKTIMALATKTNASPVIFASSTQDDKKNPLSHKEKTSYIQSALPSLSVGPETVRTIPDALTWVQKNKVTSVVIFVGGDRLPEFERLVKSWQAKNDPENGLTITVKGIPREGAMDPSLVSGTAARKFAMAGDDAALKNVLITGLTSSQVKEIAEKIRQRIAPLKEQAVWRTILKEVDDQEEDDFLNAEPASEPEKTEPKVYSKLVLHPDEALPYEMSVRAAYLRSVKDTK